MKNEKLRKPVLQNLAALIVTALCYFIAIRLQQVENMHNVKVIWLSIILTIVTLGFSVRVFFIARNVEQGHS